MMRVDSTPKTQNRYVPITDGTKPTDKSNALPSAPTDAYQPSISTPNAETPPEAPATGGKKHTKKAKKSKNDKTETNSDKKTDKAKKGPNGRPFTDPEFKPPGRPFSDENFKPQGRPFQQQAEEAGPEQPDGQQTASNLQPI
jgi:hypothetical protein